MAIHRESGISLSKLSTFRMGGTALEMVTLETEGDVEHFFAAPPPGKKWFVVGGGSNVIFPDGEHDTLIIRYADSNIEIKTDTEDDATLVVGAGAKWDDVVAYAVAHDLSGIEALSWIPGTAGATPIQNVGAYGAEIKDVLLSVRAYDIAEKKFVELSNQECRFGYRDSIFKHEAKGRYLITEIKIVLSHEEPNVPQYQGVAEYLAEKEITRASLADIRAAIIAIRNRKLPDPKEIASVGSFFKNPFVPAADARILKERYPNLAVFPVNEKVSKVGAGSLIDTLGWKGKRIGNFSFFKGNAMVIVNEGGGTKEELFSLIGALNHELQGLFGIALEPEPEILEF